MRMWMWPMVVVMVMVHAIVQAHAVLLHRMLLVWLMLLLLVLRDVRGEATRAAPQCDGDFAVEHLEGNCWD